jgi:hypothetical protein
LGWTAEAIALDTCRYSASSKLPAKEQLASIYNPSSNSSSIPSKGAAQASGWVSLAYWTGSLISDASGTMFALGVFAGTGNYATYPVNSATQAAAASPLPRASSSAPGGLVAPGPFRFRLLRG